jgi:hypothetical protein
MLHPLHNSTLLAAVALRNSTPSRSCGFTRCCARRRRHRERCQACRVQMAPSRVNMTSILSLLFCIFRAASRAQTAFSPNDIKVNLTCVCRVQMAPPRVRMTSFLSLLFGIYWAASPAQTAFSPKNINGFSIDILPRVPREGPPSRQNDFLFITAFRHILGCFSGPNRFFPEEYQRVFLGHLAAGP